MVVGAFLTLLAATCSIGATPPPPAIALVIDDLGYQPAYDQAALALPGAVTYAILPFSPHGRELAEAARAAGKDMLVHLPMEAQAKNELLGPGALMQAMPQAQFVERVMRALAELPDASGVNNHMGSVLTADLEHMRWLMHALHTAGHLIYVDSRTTPHTRAGQAAAEADVPYLGRDVFLDNQLDASAIELQFDRLLTQAKRRGFALAIAHPHAATLAVLRHRLADLGAVELLSVAQLAERRACTIPPQPALAVPLASWP